MALDWGKTGPNHVPSYQTSGVPYVTGSLDAGENLDGVVKKFTFPYVTRDLTFFVDDGTGILKVGFSENGVTGSNAAGEIHYIRITQSNSGKPIEVRCKEVFISSTNATCKWSMVAGLTTIRYDQFPVLTGSIDGTTAFEGIG
jgi:hypothetical protein